MDANLRFEIKAEAFRQMTGYLAPGKDCIKHDPEVRRAAWEVWNSLYGPCIAAMLSAMECHSEGTPRWIPVSERLPEFPESSIKSSGNSVKVIVFTGYFVTALDYARNVYAKTAKGQAPRFEWEGRISPWPVTHWMPLPEGPSK